MLTGRVATMSIVLVASFLIPRILGVDSYGDYRAVLAVVAIVNGISMFGMPQVEVRYLPALWRGKDKATALTLGSTTWGMRLLLSVAAGLAAFFLLQHTVAGQGGIGVVLALSAFCALFSAYEATRNQLLAIGETGKYVAIEFAYSLLRIPLVIGCFLAYGLAGVFFGLPLLQIVTLGVSVVLLRRVFPLDPRKIVWSSFRPHLSYSTYSFAAALCGVFQAQAAILAVATWVSAREAGYLGVATQLYLLLRSLFLHARRPLIPLLAGLQADEVDIAQEYRIWGERMLRYGTAVACIVLAVWVVSGRELVRLLLGEEFNPVYPAATLLILSLIPLSIAESCSALLYLRDRPKIALVQAVIHTGTLLGGLMTTVFTERASSENIGWVYVGASSVFLITSYMSLGSQTGIRLSFRPVLLSGVFCAAASMAIFLDITNNHGVSTANLLAALGVAIAAVLGLIPCSDLRKGFRALSGRGNP